MSTGLASLARNTGRRLAVAVSRVRARLARSAPSSLAEGSPSASEGSGGGLRLALAAGLLFGLKLLALSVIAIEAFYLLAGNALLTSGAIARLATTDSGSFELRHGLAYTLWPGHVRAHDVSVRGRDSKLEWYAAADAATFRIELLELAERRFHAPRTQIEGGVFRMRFLLEPDEVDTPRARALPAIPGADLPPVKRAGPPEPPEEEDDSVTAHLEHVEASMREIHIDAFRLHGPSRVRGGFFLAPGERVEVHASRLFVDGADLAVGGATVLRGAKSAVLYRMRSFAPKETDGDAVLRTISALALSQSEVPGMDALRPYLPEGFGVEDGSGWLRVGVGLHDGKVAAGSSIAYDTERLFFELERFALSLSGSVEGRAEGPAEGSRGRLVAAANLPAASLFAPASETGGAPPIELRGARAAISDDGLSLVELGEAPLLALDLDEGRVPDMRWVNAVLGGKGGSGEGKGSELRFEGGSARTEAHFSLSKKERRGSVRLEGEKVALAALGLGMRFDLEATASVLPEVPEGGWLAPKVLFRSTATARPVTLRELEGDDRWTDWWTRLEAPRFEIGKEGLDAELRLSAKDTRPVVEILEARGIIPGPVGLLLVLDDWKGRARLGYHDKRLSLKVAEMSAGPVAGEGFLFQKDKAYGAWRLEGGPISIGIAHEPGGTEFEPAPSAAWLAQRRARFAAKVK